MYIFGIIAALAAGFAFREAIIDLLRGQFVPAGLNTAFGVGLFLLALGAA